MHPRQVDRYRNRWNSTFYQDFSALQTCSKTKRSSRTTKPVRSITGKNSLGNSGDSSLGSFQRTRASAPTVFWLIKGNFWLVVYNELPVFHRGFHAVFNILFPHQALPFELRIEQVGVQANKQSFRLFIALPRDICAILRGNKRDRRILYRIDTLIKRELVLFTALIIKKHLRLPQFDPAAARSVVRKKKQQQMKDIPSNARGIFAFLQMSTNDAV